MKLDPKKCPCGCSNVILHPVCYCQCSSVQPDEAREVMVRVNRFDDVLAMLEVLSLNRSTEGLRKMGLDLLIAVKAELGSAEPFEDFDFIKERKKWQNR